MDADRRLDGDNCHFHSRVPRPQTLPLWYIDTAGLGKLSWMSEGHGRLVAIQLNLKPSRRLVLDPSCPQASWLQGRLPNGDFISLLCNVLLHARAKHTLTFAFYTLCSSLR